MAEEEAKEDIVIAGTILLDTERTLRGAVAEVRLRDVGFADAPARTVASTRIAGDDAAVGTIRFRLAARVERARDYALDAEIRRDGGDRLRPGDLRTTAHHGWSTEISGEVTLAVKPIS